MSTEAISRRAMIAGAAATGVAVASFAAASAEGAATLLANTAPDSIRPFRVDVPEAALADLRRRIRNTRWPDAETVRNNTQGAQLTRMQGLMRYWGENYNWRKAEARLNALPQFTTTVDGVEIHFIHVRSRHPGALPCLVAHGWPGSVIEQIGLIGPLTDPTRHGGRAEDAFDVVIPSLPGFGFSGRPTEAGWSPDRMGRAFAVLMQRLGYTHYVAQGGDWGSVIAEAMGRHAPAGLLGIHVNLPAAVPSEVGPALLGVGPVPAGLSADEAATVEGLKSFIKDGNLIYSSIMSARPQAVGYGMTDSPVGLAGFMLVHPGFAHWSFGEDPRQTPFRDEVLDNLTLYWLTNSAVSAARIYWENGGKSATSSAGNMTTEISVPVAITVFPEEVYRPPESWARRAFRNLIYFNHADRGGHFAGWEHPELFAQEMRAAFKPLRRKE